MATDEIVLFDLASKPPCRTWSYNPWKARFVINFKGLKYKTEWLQYPDLKPRLAAHFPKDQTEFTIPTVMMPDGSYVMDSWKIAELLDKTHPEPSLHLDSPVLPRLREILGEAMTAMRPIYVPLVVKRLLTEYNYPYWYETREKLAGMPLDQWHDQYGGEAAYGAAGPHLKKLTALLKETEDGPFFMGKIVSFSDFVWAGCLVFMRRIGEDVFGPFLEATGDAEVHLRLLEAVSPWASRDDH